MAQMTIEESDLEDFSVKQQTCYILCGREVDKDCKQDMGVVCNEYGNTFEDLFQSEHIGDVDPDAWEEEEKKDDLEPETPIVAKDSKPEKCDEEIAIKLEEEEPVSSIYTDEDED